MTRDPSTRPTAPPPPRPPSTAASFTDETDVNAPDAACASMPDWLRRRPTPHPSALSIGETTGEVRLEVQAPIPFAPPPSFSPALADEASRPRLTHAATAALHGAAAASNAAAGALQGDAGREEVARAAAPARSAPERAGVRAPVQLLWFDHHVAQRARTRPVWSAVLRALEDQPLDRDADDYDSRFSTQAVEDRRVVFEILSIGEPSTSSLPDVLNDAILRSGRFVPPMILLAGDLEPTFDERAMLAAVSSFAEPFRANDDELRSALDDAGALLRLPSSASLPPEVCASFSDRVRKALLRKRGATAQYVDEQIARALMRDRAYARRRVLGGEHLRMTFHAGHRVAPAYLPTAIADVLPMFSKVSVRLIAEVEPRVDAAEDSPIALRVGALARALTPI